MSDQVLFIIAAVIAIPILYFWVKMNRRCPNCKKDWSWKTVSSHNEPSGTTVQKKHNGSTTATQDLPSKQSWTEETIEVGTTITEKECSSCGHQGTQRSGYRKVIGRTNYTTNG